MFIPIYQTFWNKNFFAIWKYLSKLESNESIFAKIWFYQRKIARMVQKTNILRFYINIMKINIGYMLKMKVAKSKWNENEIHIDIIYNK